MPIHPSDMTPTCFEVQRLAARAAGFSVRWSAERVEDGLLIAGANGERPWRPLESNDDATRLQNRLQIQVRVCKRSGHVRAEENAILEPRFAEVAVERDDPERARRLAIVLLAARLLEEG